MFEKTEGAIKNWQSRDNDNIGHTRHETMTTLGTLDTRQWQHWTH
jgi:hypothetical protein